MCELIKEYKSKKDLYLDCLFLTTYHAMFFSNEYVEIRPESTRKSGIYTFVIGRIEGIGNVMIDLALKSLEIISNNSKKVVMKADVHDQYLYDDGGNNTDWQISIWNDARELKNQLVRQPCEG